MVKKTKKGGKEGFGYFKSVWDWLCGGDSTSFETLRCISAVDLDYLKLKIDIARNERLNTSLQKKFKKYYDKSFE